jgi:alpha-tubulin suppressor-like RCC1 family protein
MHNIANKKITIAAASSQYSACITSNGELYTWGQGPLGYSMTPYLNADASDPSMLSSSPSSSSTPTNMEPIYIPRRVRYVSFFQHSS